MLEYSKHFVYFPGPECDPIDQANACLFLASPLAEMLLDRVEHMKGTGITVIRSVLALAVLAVCIILLMSDTYNPFIYFRF